MFLDHQVVVGQLLAGTAMKHGTRRIPNRAIPVLNFGGAFLFKLAEGKGILDALAEAALSTLMATGIHSASKNAMRAKF